MKKSAVENYRINEKDKSWIYTGEIYKIDNSIQVYKSIRFKLLICIFSLLFITILIGIIDFKALRVIYISVPYILQLLPIVLMISDLYYIYKFKNNDLTIRQYQKSYGQLKNALKFLVILSIACLANLIVVQIINKYIGYDIIFIVLEILIIVIAYNSRVFYKQLNIIKITGTISGKL